jgi:hypothetical protein
MAIFMLCFRSPLISKCEIVNRTHKVLQLQCRFIKLLPACDECGCRSSNSSSFVLKLCDVYCAHSSIPSNHKRAECKHGVNACAIIGKIFPSSSSSPSNSSSSKSDVDHHKKCYSRVGCEEEIIYRGKK